MSKASRASSKVPDLPANVARKAGDRIVSSGKSPIDADASPNITKAERTREFIQAQAAPLFNKRGFAGTSLVDLTEATGLTKGALYGNFKDKEGIALATFSYSMQVVRKVMKGRLDDLTSNKQKLIALLEFFGEYVIRPPIPGGCPMMNYGVEADDSQRFMKKAVAREMQATVKFIQQCLERGMQAGEFEATVDAAALAQMIFCSIEGAIVVSRVTGNSAPMEAVVTHCKAVFDQVTCR